MTYNGFFVSEDDQDRFDAFQTVFDATQPDILVMQEIINEEGADFILDILNASSPPALPAYGRALFIDGPDMDNMLFYRNSIVDFTGQDTIGTDLRVISEYRLAVGGNELFVYSAHLKSAEGSRNKNRRLQEATRLRERLDALPDTAEFLVAGDFNFYTSSEPAYQMLLSVGEDSSGRAMDFVADSLIGSWHNNERYAAVHTQNTRHLLPNGANAGGVDDRFDFILGSFGLNNDAGIEYVSDSYQAFGNDGAHFNLAINDGFNAAVSPNVADALYEASDHLPVIADFFSLSPDSLFMPVIISEVFYDTPGVDGDEEWIELYNRSDAPIDLDGWTLTDNNGTGRSFTFGPGFVMAPKTYFTIANEPDAFFSIYGYDADHYDSLPPLNNSGDALVLVDPTDRIVDAVAWEGGAGSGLPDGWGSTTEPSAPRGHAIARIDRMMDTNTYVDWARVGNNGDPQTQPALIADVDTFTAVSNERGAFIDVQHELKGNYPNPARVSTTIEFEMATSEWATVQVFDMLGREVRTLVDGHHMAGSHRVVFDTSQLANGVYLYRLQTSTYAASAQLIVRR